MHQLNIELQSLIDIQDNPFVLIDRDYHIVAANRAYCTAYGIAAEDIIGRKCHEVSHHSPAPCHENGENCPHQKVFSTGRACEALHTHYDDHNRPEHVRLKGYPIFSKDQACYLGEMIFPLSAPTELDCDDMRMIGRSPAFLSCVENLTAAAESEAPVLLYGESGVGKELAASYVHKRSARRDQAYVAVDCASISEPLFESELFGHERGAFTGCVGRKIGLFELANHGTLFLDEIGEIPLSMQPKLLRVLETGQFRRVGGREVLKADVRVVSATNRMLLDMVDKGLFRLDLYYRISGIDVQLPPLRERRMDIPALAEAMLAKISNTGARRLRLTKEALQRLKAYHYPGNVRELKNILLKAAALSNGVIGEEHILFNEARPLPVDEPAASVWPPSRAPQAHPSMNELEAQYVADLLAQHNGHRRTVAQILGISERTLYRKLNRYGLKAGSCDETPA
ncbi:MAG: sigma 54-interacting transcriptional regulator [Betaproteobacteria bacterium]|nr:sigma 54-interacting transcriptional regulator [Betaproteobacteria bacterium]